VIPVDVLFTTERPFQRFTHDEVFPDLVGWGQVVTLSANQPGTTVARLELRSLEIIRRDPATNLERVVGRLPLENYAGRRLPCEVVGGATSGECVGANFSRTCPSGAGGRMLCWFTETTRMTPMANSHVSGGVLTIDVAQTPDQVPHFWTVGTSAAYRSTSEPGYEYYVSAEFRVTGAAAVNFGMDRWRAGACPPGYVLEEADQPACTHKQSWYGIWVGDTGGNWIVSRFPLRFGRGS
jgi:hypothetical protein